MYSKPWQEKRPAVTSKLNYREISNLSGNHSNCKSSGLSCVESYAGDIPQATKRPKTIKDLKVALQLVLEDLLRKPIKKALWRDSEHVWAILVVDKFNLRRDALISLFCNNYLTHGLKIWFLLHYGDIWQLYVEIKCR